jgi:PAS domain S-box-containing protein
MGKAVKREDHDEVPGQEEKDVNAGGAAAAFQPSMLQAFIENAAVSIFALDAEYRYLSFNPSHAAMMKSLYGSEVRAGAGFLDCITIPSDRLRFRENLDRALLRGERVIEEVTIGDTGLSRPCFEIYHNAIRDDGGKAVGVLVIARDVSERKQMEQRIQSQARDLDRRIRELDCLYGLSRLIEAKDNSLEDIYSGTAVLIPAAMQFPQAACARLTVAGREFATPNWKNTAFKHGAKILVNGEVSGKLEVCYLEQQAWDTSGPFPKEEQALVQAMAERLGHVIERRQAEEAILRSKALLQSVVDATPDFIYVKDLEHRYLLVNRSFALSQDREPREMVGRPDTEFFSEELCMGSPEKGIKGFHADDNEAFRGHLVQNPGNLVTWADGSEHIYDTYKIPLSDLSGKIYAALVFSRDATALQRIEEGSHAARMAMQHTLHAFIDTVADVIEMRDPSTAGHQRRVAALAGAIAREMRLDESRVENVVMAAKIHDIGKMLVPRAVLNKPGKLTDPELSMVITHAQGSYDILWKAEFSKQVAQMVLQHHERMDGSGYPNELKGEQIILEARILAVADVVEAVTSNRPYRKTYGLDNALQEISNNRGRLYDPAVADACLKLFREKRFKFDE